MQMSREGKGLVSVVKCLPNTHKALHSIPSTMKKKEIKRKEVMKEESKKAIYILLQEGYNKE